MSKTFACDHALLIHGDDCYVIIYRYGYGDQMKLNEFIRSDDGVYFDNCGFDSRKFHSEETLMVAIKSRFPAIVVKDLRLKPQSITFEHEFSYPGFEIDAGTRFVSGISSHGSTVEELWANSKVSGETMRGSECMYGWTAGDIQDASFEACVEALFIAALKEAEGAS